MENKPVHKNLKLQVKLQSNGKCHYCGTILDYKNPYCSNSFVVDHVNPRFLGGGDDIDNLAACCVSCNSKKGKKSLEKFREWYQRILGMSFSQEQRDYWGSKGIILPEDSAYLFYFEDKTLYEDNRIFIETEE